MRESSAEVSAAHASQLISLQRRWHFINGSVTDAWEPTSQLKSTFIIFGG